MSMIDTDEGKKLLAQVEVGLDAEAFLSGTLGEYSSERIIDDREAALAELEVVDAHNPTEIIRAQNNARVPVLFLQYLNDCIEEGKQAERLLYEIA